MPRELRIGDRVRTPAGEQIVIALSRPCVTTATRADVDTLYARDALYPHEWEREQIEPLPPNVPRERVADLHAAVTKRLEQLGGYIYAEAFARRELSEVAESLRLLLEVPSE